MNLDLFTDAGATLLRGSHEQITPGAALLRGFTAAESGPLLESIRSVIALAPLRHMVTPGGHRMSVTTTSCGALGWVSDDTGYRYEATDPATGRAWPTMPAPLMRLAVDAAEEAGFAGFVPDACLINRYGTGDRMSLHQDRNERDFRAPIVSVSLGLPVVFLFGGFRRTDRALRLPLAHGDVVVWGGPARMRFHGVLPLKPGDHPLTGAQRINLTFRKAG